MASPQLENGHTQIANEILEAFCRAFPGGANAQVLLAIIRRTYGWRKREDAISISQLQEMTGLARRTIIYALQNLEAKRFITIKRQRGRGHVNEINNVSFQKNYELWVVQRKSSQWEKQLQKKRENYQQEVVQRKNGGSAEKLGSAENGQGVVQRNDKKGKFSAPTKERKKYTKEKSIYGEFENVLLTEQEHEKLRERLGGEAQEYIERLSRYLKSKSRRYNSHYATILSWKDKDAKEGKCGTAHNSRSLPERHSYTQSPKRDD